MTVPFFAGPYAYCKKFTTTVLASSFVCTTLNCGLHKDKDGKYCKWCGQILSEISYEKNVTGPAYDTVIKELQTIPKFGLKKAPVICYSSYDADFWIPDNRGYRFVGILNFSNPHTWEEDNEKFKIDFEKQIAILKKNYPTVEIRWGVLQID